ncbi:MAG TPA: Ig-like domain-containing protein [Gemmatimonadaceae bacterium]|nr:Ig-like domain-containing protein [Gemmatimonadaceae bacterium]
MRNQSLRHRLRVVALLTAALACGGGGEVAGPGPITQLSLILPADSMHIGEVLQATLAAKDGSGAAVSAEVWDAVWTSSTPSVASVTQRGIVRAVGIGQTRIGATIGGHSSEVLMRVVAIPVALVSLSPLSIVLPPGATRQLLAVPLDATGRELQGRSIAWLSSDTSVVVVSTSGVVTALSPGITSVHAISEGSYASADVRVSGPPGAVAKVTLIPAAAGIKIGESLQLATILEDAIGNVATDRPVTWTTSAPSVATVSASGRVTGVGAGSAVIEAMSEQIRGRATITVLDPNDAITVNFASPDSNDVVSDTLAIYSSASGRNPIVRAYAVVASKETELSEKRVGFNGLQQAWIGTLDMRDLRYGPYELVVTVWDSKGNIGIGTVLFKRGARTGAGGTTIPPKIK